MRRGAVLLSCLLFFGLAALGSCRPSGDQAGRGGRLLVVTTLFPLYDFAKNVCGAKGDVELLLPPGVEPHSFEPKPGDVMKIHKADIFVYTGAFMEPWAATIIEGALRRDLVVVDSSRGIRLRQESEDQGPDKAARRGGAAPGP